MKQIEVELKFEVTSDSEIQEVLSKGFTHKSTDRLEDIYFDNLNNDLFKKGVFIRVRNQNTLDFKFNMRDIQSERFSKEYTHCNEYSFDLPITVEKISALHEVLELLGLNKTGVTSFDSFLIQNNLLQSIAVDKTRDTYTKQNINVCVDEIKELGRFVEIEILVNNENQINAAKKTILSLFPGNKKPVTTGYVALTWRNKDFETYKAGKYHTAEDRALFEKE
jgi:predicted adenylyl cyclase CyaB